MPRAPRAEHALVKPLPDSPVVIVEDDEQMCRAMRRILETEGHVTETFDTAEAFIASNAATRAKCLVLDVNLPGISGMELHRQLRSESHVIPTVVVTGRDIHARWVDFRETDCFLFKPFSAEALAGAVGRCVNRDRPEEDPHAP